MVAPDAGDVGFIQQHKEEQAKLSRQTAGQKLKHSITFKAGSVKAHARERIRKAKGDVLGTFQHPVDAFCRGKCGPFVTLCLLMGMSFCLSLVGAYYNYSVNNVLARNDNNQESLRVTLLNTVDMTRTFLAGILSIFQVLMVSVLMACLIFVLIVCLCCSPYALCLSFFR